MYISLNEIMTRYEYEFLSKGKRGGSGVQAKNNKYYKYWNELEDKLRVYAWFGIHL